MNTLTQLQVVSLMALASRNARLLGAEPPFNFESIACIASADANRFEILVNDPTLQGFISTCVLAAESEGVDFLMTITNMDIAFRKQFEVMTRDPQGYQTVVDTLMERADNFVKQMELKQ